MSEKLDKRPEKLFFAKGGRKQTETGAKDPKQTLDRDAEEKQQSGSEFSSFPSAYGETENLELDSSAVYNKTEDSELDSFVVNIKMEDPKLNSARTAQDASNLETVASVDLDQDAPIQETQESLGRYRDASSPENRESQSRDQDALTPEKQAPLSRDQEGVLAFLRNNNLSTDPTDSSVDPSSPEGLVDPSSPEGLVDPTSLEVSIDPISSDSSADLSSLEVSANNFEDGSIQEKSSETRAEEPSLALFTNRRTTTQGDFDENDESISGEFKEDEFDDVHDAVNLEFNAANLTDDVAINNFDELEGGVLAFLVRDENNPENSFLVPASRIEEFQQSL